MSADSSLSPGTLPHAALPGAFAENGARLVDPVAWVHAERHAPLASARWAVRLGTPWEVHWSDATCDQYRVPRGSAPPSDLSFFSSLHPDDANLAARAWQKAIAVPGEYCWRVRIRRGDDVLRHVVTRMTSLCVDAHGERWYLGVDQDVTDLVHDQIDMDRERAFRFVADNLKDVVFRLSRAGVVEYVSRSARHLLGREPESLVGQHIRTVVHPDDVDRAEAAMLEQIAARRVVRDAAIEYRVIRADGTTTWIESAPRLVFDANGDLLAIVDAVRDVTQRRQAAERIAYMATHDGLTDLPNRRAFHERLAAELAVADAASPLAVACLDLDGFKAVNDLHGHAAGDEVLRQVAERLRHTLPARAYAGRLGGDEFAVLLPGVSQAAATAWAARIVESIARPFVIDGERSASIGVSVGLAEAPTHGRDADGLLRRADEALYRCKPSLRMTGRG